MKTKLDLTLKHERQQSNHRLLVPPACSANTTFLMTKHNNKGRQVTFEFQYRGFSAIHYFKGLYGLIRQI